MTLKDIEVNLKRVSDVYAEKFSIKRDDDWFILKIQEELGELTAARLKLTQRARIGKLSTGELQKNLEDEVADVIAMTILFAEHKGIDVETAIKNKWFKYL